MIVVAHLYGTPGKIYEIKVIYDKYGAVIVEDVGEVLGATYKGDQTGSFGTIGCISLVGGMGEGAEVVGLWQLSSIIAVQL